LQDILRFGFELCRGNNASSAEDLLKRLESTKQSIYLNPHLAPLLDSFNQMGNVDFLRKWRTLSQQPNPNLLPDIKKVFAEYFASVKSALTKITKALSRIESDLRFESTPTGSDLFGDTEETSIP
jgi:hypothetical protein